MSSDRTEALQILGNLSKAVEMWVGDGNEGHLTRWLGRELDREGAPIRLSNTDMHTSIRLIGGMLGSKKGTPDLSPARLAELILAALRFARPDGSPSMTFDSSGGDPASTWTSTDWARRYRGTGIARVLGWWFDPKTKEQSPPPLPAWSAKDRVLAALRPDWLATGDFLTVDHREAREPCKFELFGGGRSWLGPIWSGPETVEPNSRPKPRTWITGSVADLVEWSYLAGKTRITRSALLLRGRRMAVLSVQADGIECFSGSNCTMRVSLPPEIFCKAVKGSRALSLSRTKDRGSAQVLPLALPDLPYVSDRGEFQAQDNGLTLTQTFHGRRTWLPLVVSWEPARNRTTVNWRTLTVSERARPVPADRAFAARLSWSNHETYVIYRSLGPPAPRAFLGHQTRARFLFGQFTEDGTIKPILTVN